MHLLHAPCRSTTSRSSTHNASISSAPQPAALLHPFNAQWQHQTQHNRFVNVLIAPGPLPSSISSHVRRTTAVRAQQGPDRGSVAALESAIAAINNILGTYNKVRGTGKAGNQQGPGSSKTAAGASVGPSKLISFGAKAAGSVPVKEVLKAAAVQEQDSGSRSTNDTAAHSSRTNGKHQHSSSSQGHRHHKHSNSHKHKAHSSSGKSNRSWLPQLTGQQFHSKSDCHDSNGELIPAEALERSLQAYLALPLEQYSVLDPKLITRLPPGLDIEVFLGKLLAAQKARKAEKTAQQQLQQQGLEAVLQAGSEVGNGSSSSKGSSGTSLHPIMKELPATADGAAASAAAAAAAVGDIAPPASSSSGSGSTAAEDAAASTSSSSEASAATAVADQSDVSPTDSAGAFLLRIPMKELLGVDLEPLLVIYVDIDAKHAQVTFRTNRLVIGDPRFDQEFKVDLTAKMSSKIQQPAIQVTSAGTTAAAAAAAGESGASHSSSSTMHSNGSPASGAVSSSSTEAPTLAVEQQEAAAPAAPMWQRNSTLSCKVKLSMTLRLPHPLSIVPGPLLSTTASLVAKLVMQALLPSFLELLATDYGRWASGSSTAARQALPAGSLVAAGKQQLQQVQQQQQEEGKKKEAVSS